MQNLKFMFGQIFDWPLGGRQIRRRLYNEEYFQDCKIIFQFSFSDVVCKHSCLEIFNQKDILRNIVFRGGFILYSNLIHETEVSGNIKWTKNDFIIFPKKSLEL